MESRKLERWGKYNLKFSESLMERWILMINRLKHSKITGRRTKLKEEKKSISTKYCQRLKSSI